MKTTLKALSLLLALVMLACSFVACGDTRTPDDKDSDTVAGTTEDNVNDGSLKVIDWGGETYSILGRDGNGRSQFDNFEVGYDELPVDVVGIAVYKRNENLKNKYNFKVEPIFSVDVAATAQVAYESGDDLYDLAIYRHKDVQAHAQSGYLLNIADLDHINLDYECWYQDVNKELTIGDKLYYTTNNFLLQDKHRFWYCFYNREIARDLNLGYFEDMVDNNTWTLENVTRLTKQGYSDKDGEAGRSPEDHYGYGAQEYYAIAALAFGAGFRLTEKDNYNIPKLVGATDHAINILDKVFGLMYHNASWITPREDPGVANKASEAELMFNEGRLLLLSTFTSSIDYFLSDDEFFEYGVLPNPKIDSEQENYYSFTHVTTGSFLAVPYTVMDEEFAGYALEAISEESTDTSYTAYIDTKCKYQDAYDEDCARMFDLCFRNCTYDIGAFCDFGGIFSALWRGEDGGGGLAALGKGSIYKRFYDTYKKGAQSDIDEIVEKYSKE